MAQPTYLGKSPLNVDQGFRGLVAPPSSFCCRFKIQKCRCKEPLPIVVITFKRPLRGAVTKSRCKEPLRITVTKSHYEESLRKRLNEPLRRAVQKIRFTESTRRSGENSRDEEPLRRSDEKSRYTSRADLKSRYKGMTPNSRHEETLQIPVSQSRKKRAVPNEPFKTTRMTTSTKKRRRRQEQRGGGGGEKAASVQQRLTKKPPNIQKYQIIYMSIQTPV